MGFQDIIVSALGELRMPSYVQIPYELGQNVLTRRGAGKIDKL